MTTMNERDLYYGQRLAEMIRCKTVSHKEGFEPEEFLKLRRVIGTLFPLVTEKAERTILGEDAYLYKLPGKDPSRNVLLMSHHDVVEATGSWQEAPFAGVIRGGKLWGRGTVDTKTPLFAEFSALEELLLEGFEFPVNVYLFSSHNEEYSGDGALLAHDYFIEHSIRFDWISDEGGAVVGINSFTLDGDKAAIAEAKDILAKKGVTYSNLWFASDSEAGKFTAGLYSFPTTYVVDKNGNIVGQPIVGAITAPDQAKKLNELIDQALASSK